MVQMGAKLAKWLYSGAQVASKRTLVLYIKELPDKCPFNYTRDERAKVKGQGRSNGDCDDNVNLIGLTIKLYRTVL